ncbi:uncharacterized protein LOC118195264 isoform X2 [Stegodyphus dumicola]|uniref:uncharacterized protein LOC118195264 isoform X2 n=1 Tax=Stegodyphus dumicola TaxID=202533 RepID=UPI0015B11F27|nr:uncharacterized protein LOC118195264 isoform X2 [Stegodyphus dumicola]
MNRPTLRRSERLANRRTAVRHKDLQVPKRTHRRRAMNRTLFEGQLNQSTASDRQQGRSLAGQELRGGIRDVREQQRQDEQQPAEQQQSAEVAYVRQHTASAAQQQDRSIDGQQQRDEIPRIGEQTDSRNEQSDEVTIIGQQIADDNDVIYMYTVDHQNGRIVEIVDLAEENQTPIDQNIQKNRSHQKRGKGTRQTFDVLLVDVVMTTFKRGDRVCTLLDAVTCCVCHVSISYLNHAGVSSAE